MTTDIENFWLKKKWPVDMTGYIFLARAINTFGEFLFPDGWTGLEPIPPRDLLPETTGGQRFSTGSDAPPWLQWRLHRILAKHRPDLARPASRPDYYPAKISVTEWQIALNFAREEDKLALKSQFRFQTTIDMLRTAFTSELIRTFVRPVKGGDFTSVPAIHWNADDLSPRVSFCRMHPNEPFSIAIDGTGYQLIYLSTTDLTNTLDQLRRRQSDQIADADFRESSSSDVSSSIRPSAVQPRGLISDATLLKWFMEEYVPALKGEQRTTEEVWMASLGRYPGKITRSMVRDMLTPETKLNIGWRPQRGRRPKYDDDSSTG